MAETQNYILAEQDYMSGMKYKDIAKKYGVTLNTVKSWKVRHGWNKKGVHTKSEKVCTQNKKRGAPPGNQNAAGHGAPKGNQNAKKHGLFSRYLPEDTLELFTSLDSAEPLDLLWDQIKLAYAAILRAQPIMYVKDKDDKTKSKIEKKRGKISGEKWEIQYAWDKQASFLTAQAKAQAELSRMIRQYDELLHKNWDMASEEQKARIDQMKANAERLKQGASSDEDEGVEIINDAPEEAGPDIGDNHTEIPADIQ